MPGEFSRDVFLSYNNAAREIPSSPSGERETAPRPHKSSFSPTGGEGQDEGDAL